MKDTRPSLEIIAPTVDEAIAQGATELGLPEEALEIEILDEGGGGLFGLGSRQARVRLTVRSAEGQPSAAPVASESPAETEDRIEDTDLDEEAEALRITRDTVEELLQRMNIQAEVDAYWGEADTPGKIKPLHVEIHGDDLSILIGRRGKTLSALQYITRLIVGKELKRPVSVMIDVEGYRERREQQLRRLARRMATQAVETSRTMSLEPMPAYERRIVHIELRGDPQVETLSVGEGKRRKVTIVPKG
ncbi:MAG: Jag N-terminal domain-containing protein [Anaerolineales bacterium]|nr:Jag N-terminal domain-containing protein [Anaerolineales bacterium]